MIVHIAKNETAKRAESAKSRRRGGESVMGGERILKELEPLFSGKISLYMQMLIIE